MVASSRKQLQRERSWLVGADLPERWRGRLSVRPCCPASVLEPGCHLSAPHLSPWLSPYLRGQLELDLIHEDESVGVRRLWPAQEAPVLMALPGHQPRNVISLLCGEKVAKVTTEAEGEAAFTSFSVFTCRFGSGEDKLCSAATLDLSVAGVDVDPVDGERLQAGDLQLALRHGLLRELKVSVQRLCAAAAAAVAVSLDRRKRAAVEGRPAVAPVCGVSYTKDIPPASIWRPAEQRQPPKVGKEAPNDAKTQQHPAAAVVFLSSDRTLET